MDQIKVQVSYKIEDFSDALYYSLEDYQNLDPQVIEGEKQKRFQNWKAFVEEQSNIVRPEPVKGELTMKEAEEFLSSCGFILKPE